MTFVVLGEITILESSFASDNFVSEGKPKE